MGSPHGVDREEQIGEYRVQRLIGEGGMGRVYEAEERLSGRRVALKVLRSELTATEEGRRMFLGEMEILAKLEHPNVVRSLASMEHEGRLVMALELLNGRTLRQELTRRGKIPWVEAVEIAAQIAEALAAAHTHEPSIVHRDLKPENVMLTSESDGAVTLKVMDFGVAKVRGGGATTSRSVGTLAYMSPEQIDARPVDARADLYALGLVLYEMIAGRAPFRSESPRELLNLQCTSEPPPFEDDVRASIPRGVEELVRALLEKEPSTRPASARDVIAELGPFRPAGERPAVSATRRVNATTSTKHAGKLDTVALVRGSNEVATGLAILLIVMASLIAGMATYMLRVRASAADRAIDKPVPTERASASR